MCQCEHFGLLLAKNLKMEDFGALGQYIKTAATFADALQATREFITLNTTEMHREIHSDQQLVYFSQRSRSGIAVPAVILQFTVALNWIFNRYITQQKWQAKYISFSFSQPIDRKPYENLFGVPIIFDGEFDGLAFAIDDLNMTLPDHDELLHRTLKQHVQTLKAALPSHELDHVRALIAQHLHKGSVTMASICQHLPYEKRTLQRKLKHQQQSFQNLLNDVRFQQAQVWLCQSPLSIGQISDNLGYANSSAFSQAFKKRFGISPLQWRNQQSKP